MSTEETPVAPPPPPSRSTGFSGHDLAITVLKRRRRRCLTALGIFGFLILIPPILAVVGSAFAMQQTFKKLETNPTPDPADLAAELNIAVLGGTGGILCAFAGLIGFVVCLVMFVRIRKALRAVEEEG